MMSVRLKTYMSKLVVFPRKGGKAKKGFGGMPDDVILKDLKDKISPNALIDTLVPLPRKQTTIVFRAPTEAERNCNVYEMLRAARRPPRPEKD